MLSIYAVLVNCYDFTFHTPVTFMSPNDLFNWFPKAVRSLSNFCVVICRLGKQRLSALQR